MIKKVAYMLIPACMTVSVAMAGPLSSNEMLLTADQMDQVSAGLAANVDAYAIGVSPVLALSKVVTTANVVQTGSNSHLTGGGVVVGGLAGAGAAGNGSATATSVEPTTDLSGPNTQSIQLNLHSAGGLINVSGAGIVAVSAPTVNPL
ncbi:MAG: hypothetical protein ACXWF8_03815 [Methylobacter sp.]